jgi:RNA polymerase sigma-70 factor (ECF subfamily)
VCLILDLERLELVMFINESTVLEGSPCCRRHRLNQTSDEALMLAYQEGDTSGFEVVLKRYEKGIYHFALRMMDDRMQAEEVTQECFLRVIKACSRYKVRASFRNYLYHIARNLCFDRLRKRPREGWNTQSDANPGDLLGLIPDTNPGPENQVSIEQVRRAICNAIQSLPPDQREVFLLKEVRDMKLQDVATITGTNLNTVKSRLRYALINLREQLSREGIAREMCHEM